MIIRTTSLFDKSFAKLPSGVRNLVTQKRLRFEKDPKDVALKIHKLKGELKDVWSFSVNYQYRIIFKYLGPKEVLFINVGTHQIYH